MNEWRIAKYLRLSNEDGTGKGESESIGGQRKLIDGYIKKTPAFIAAEVFEFCDDGHTGTNFERPAMQRLLAAARQGEINCIIVKDFSRFGRSYIEVGNFLEKVLPFLGVRFISVNDGYDSENTRCIGGLDTAFKNLLNDLYSRDCSVKVKNGKRTTALQGKYQNPWAPFGYVKSVQERGKLEADPEAAEIVRHIFALFLEGRGTVEVARILNRDGVPTKSEYRAAQGDKMRWQHAGEKASWNAAAVRGILTDARYIGSVVYGKRMAKGVAAHRNIQSPAEKQVTVENCHEPLISRVDFERAQAMLTKGVHHDKSDRPLVGKIKCGVCGHAMPLRRGKEPYFTCGSKWYDGDCNCGNVRIGQGELFAAIHMILERQVQVWVEQAALEAVRQEKEDRARAGLERKLGTLEQEVAANRAYRRELFEQFARGELKEWDFKGVLHTKEGQIAQLAGEMERIREQIAELAGKRGEKGGFILTKWGEDGTIIKNRVNVSPELWDALIREVTVYPNKELQLLYSFGST